MQARLFKFNISLNLTTNIKLETILLKKFKLLDSGPTPKT